MGWFKEFPVGEKLALASIILIIVYLVIAQ
jgi:hypothetical protein